MAIIPLDAADAFSVPGGDLLFSQGLLETAGNEAALMGVVCHELAHLDRGHQLLELRRAKLNGGTRNSLMDQNAALLHLDSLLNELDEAIGHLDACS